MENAIFNFTQTFEDYGVIEKEDHFAVFLLKEEKYLCLPNKDTYYKFGKETIFAKNFIALLSRHELNERNEIKEKIYKVLSLQKRKIECFNIPFDGYTYEVFEPEVDKEGKLHIKIHLPKFLELQL